MEFEWDESKREGNIEKHDLDFRDAIAVFDEAQCVFEDVTRPEYGEIRRKAIGRLGTSLVCVIFTDRGAVRRIISARRTRRNEREQYRQSAESA